MQLRLILAVFLLVPLLATTAGATNDRLPVHGTYLPFELNVVGGKNVLGYNFELAIALANPTSDADSVVLKKSWPFQPPTASLDQWKGEKRHTGGVVYVDLESIADFLKKVRGASFADANDAVVLRWRVIPYVISAPLVMPKEIGQAGGFDSDRALEAQFITTLNAASAPRSGVLTKEDTAVVNANKAWSFADLQDATTETTETDENSDIDANADGVWLSVTSLPWTRGELNYSATMTFTEQADGEGVKYPIERRAVVQQFVPYVTLVKRF